MAIKTARTKRREEEEKKLVRERIRVGNAMKRSGSHGVFEEVSEAGDRDPLPFRAMTGTAKAFWRYRWYLAPFILSGILFGLAAWNPTIALVTSLVLALIGLIGAVNIPEEVKGRMWLSVKERYLVAQYGIVGAIWVCFSSLMSGWISFAVLLVLTGYPTVKWMQSRKIRKVPISDKNKEWLKKWKTIVAPRPGPLQSSEVVLGTINEPSPGAVSFYVRLQGVHGEDAANSTTRKLLEMLLNLGVGTVQVEHDRDNSNQMKVTITPDRHLEKNNAEWLDPVVHADGNIDLALTPSGQNIQVGLHNDAGVEHFAIAGTTGTGKSNTVVTMVLPGVLSGHEVLWYADGGRGTSATHIKNACDWRALDVDDWEAMIFAAVDVCKARHSRREEQGLDEWRGFAEDDPVLTLVCDEASLMLGEIHKKVAEAMLWLLRNGRKVGVRVGQITQDPMSDEWIGGRKARGLMAGGGSFIAHRPGDGTAAMLSLGSTANKVNLLELPPGHGWAAIIRQGQVLAPKARVRYATKPRVIEAIERAGELRTLHGDDFVAAGPAYQNRKRVVRAPKHPPAREITSSNSSNLDISDAPEKVVSGAARASAAMANANRNSILHAISVAGENGINTNSIIEATGRKKTTVYDILRELKAEQKVSKDKDGAYRLVLR